MAAPRLDLDSEINISVVEIETQGDPFTEQPLILRKSESGWRIYPVGFDLKDDGGEVDQRDVGIAPLK